MIEKLITELTEALRENTAAIKQAQSQVTVTAHTSIAESIKSAAKKAASKKPEVLPDPEPEADAGLTDEEEVGGEDLSGMEYPGPEPDAANASVEVLTPTKVSAPTRQDDTPNVPSKGRNPDGSALAAEHVDVDEVISEINATVKGKLLKAEDPETMKTKWAAIRKGYGVDRIADLRGNPAALLKALAQAKSL